MTILDGLLAAILVLITLAVRVSWAQVRAYRMNARVDKAMEMTQPSILTGLAERVRQIGEWSRRFYAANSLDHLRAVIQASGFNPHRVLPVLLGCKLTLMIAIPVGSIVLAIFVHNVPAKLAIVGAGIIIGMLGPEWGLGILRNRFKNMLIRGTPDALDLMVLCSEAGMGLESAIDRVAHEMQGANPAIASVLRNLLDDLKVLPNSRDAFNNLGTRSGTNGLRRLGTMLTQSMHYGTPLSHALRAVAEELRRDRMNRLEEKAVKLPALLIFPMIGFIMPSLYVVLLGSSFLQLYDSLSKFTLH